MTSLGMLHPDTPWKAPVATDCARDWKVQKLSLPSVYGRKSGPLPSRATPFLTVVVKVEVYPVPWKPAGPGQKVLPEAETFLATAVQLAG